MSAYPYRAYKERCMQKDEMELAAFLGNTDYACRVFGGAVVNNTLVDVV